MDVTRREAGRDGSRQAIAGARLRSSGRSQTLSLTWRSGVMP